ncbi:hypothetical protein BGS_0786 [Beggiatoa sp. SS]|nr:hypothetical protein BGS_0786 [Beggiatoa sp. SS]
MQNDYIERKRGRNNILVFTGYGVGQDKYENPGGVTFRNEKGGQYFSVFLIFHEMTTQNLKKYLLNCQRVFFYWGIGNQIFLKRKFLKISFNGGR